MIYELKENFVWYRNILFCWSNCHRLACLLMKDRNKQPAKLIDILDVSQTLSISSRYIWRMGKSEIVKMWFQTYLKFIAQNIKTLSPFAQNLRCKKEYYIKTSSKIFTFLSWFWFHISTVFKLSTRILKRYFYHWIIYLRGNLLTR